MSLSGAFFADAVIISKVEEVKNVCYDPWVFFLQFNAVSLLETLLDIHSLEGFSVLTLKLPLQTASKK